MPLVRISLLKGHTAEEILAIADGVHAALVDTFSVPQHDRFQIIEQKDSNEIIYDPSYLGIERSDGIVIVNIVASADRDTATKQALYLHDRRQPRKQPGGAPGRCAGHHIPQRTPGLVIREWRRTVCRSGA